MRGLRAARPARTSGNLRALLTIRALVTCSARSNQCAPRSAVDVGRARPRRVEAPACRDQERVVADVAAVHDAQLPEVSRLDDRPHVLDERVAAHVVATARSRGRLPRAPASMLRSPRRSSRAASRRRRARRARVPAASAPRGAHSECRRARRPPRSRRAARRASRLYGVPRLRASASAPRSYGCTRRRPCRRGRARRRRARARRTRSRRLRCGARSSRSAPGASGTSPSARRCPDGPAPVGAALGPVRDAVVEVRAARGRSSPRTTRTTRRLARRPARREAS